jgi:hypothetical protein
MVFSTSAREDVDNELLTKTIIYREYKQQINDLSRDEPAEEDIYVDYNIKAQVTVQNVGNKFVQDGILTEGDLVGLFRYRYDKDANDLLISPSLIPKSKDKIKFLNQWYVIKNVTPATNEDSGVIAWDFTARQTSLNSWEVNVDGHC